MANLRNSLIIVAVLVLSLAIVTGSFAEPAGNTSKTVMVFPLDNGTASENSQVASDISAYLADGLNTLKDYKLLVYSSRLPAVRRVITTHPEKKINPNGPFSTDDKAVSDSMYLADTAGVGFALIGSLDKLEIKNDIYEATVTIQLMDIKKKTAAQTVLLKAQSAAINGDNERAKKEAAKDAAAKIISQLTGQQVSMDSFVSDSSSAGGSAVKQSITVMQFAYGSPLDETPSESAKQSAILLNSELNKAFVVKNIFSVVRLSPETPSLKRAISEKKIKKSDITSPADTTKDGAARAIKVAQLLGTQLTAIGSVDRCTFNDKNGTLDVVATIQIVDIQSGKVTKSVTVTGNAARKGSETEKTLRSAAIVDAVQKITSQFTAKVQTPAEAPVK